MVFDIGVAMCLFAGRLVVRGDSDSADNNNRLMLLEGL